MASQQRILVVEDDPAIASVLVRSLRAASFDVTLCNDGASGAETGLRSRFDAIVLDLMLPELHGFEVLKRWANRLSTPVLVLTADADLPSRLASFELGAVDWMSKPFFAEELVARIRMRLQLQETQERRCVTWADVVLDLDSRQVLQQDQALDLTAVEFNILAYLAARPGRVVTRSRLTEDALPPGGDQGKDTLSSHLSRIRRKLGPPAAAAIHTVRGFGYKFDHPTGGV